MKTSLPTIAGFISTALFALGTLPMLIKAFRTHNLASYSLGNILMSNAGNLIYAVYVFHLPRGPVWFLHGYNLISTALMLIWYLKYEGWPRRHMASRRGSSHQHDLDGPEIRRLPVKHGNQDRFLQDRERSNRAVQGR